MPRINKKALTTELAKRGFESIAVKRELPDGRVEVEANKLHPVHVEAGESIYAPVPLSMSVALDARGRVKSIDDSGQLAGPGERAPASGLTHQIERDQQGRQVLRRRRFSMS
jgi:hypothetical protein